MLSSLVFSFLAADRPGIVEKLSSTVVDHQGNWQESSMSQLAGHFAGIARIEVAPQHLDALAQALTALNNKDITLLVQPQRDGSETAGSQLYLHIIGNDRPGIIREISAALANHQINVRSLDSRISSAPMTGEALFEAEVCVQLPSDIDVIQLYQEFDSIADDLGVDIHYEDI